MNTDTERGLLEKRERPSLSDDFPEEKQSMTATVSRHAKGMFEGLYRYTISSCASSLRLSNYWLSDEPPSRDENDLIEMKSFPPRGPNRGTPESESLDKRMKEKINLHFESHLQKWKRQRFPFKVTLHLLLIVLVTTQVSSYSQLSIVECV